MNDNSITLDTRGTVVIGADCPRCKASINEGMHICGKSGEKIFLIHPSMFENEDDLRAFTMVGGKGYFAIDGVEIEVEMTPAH